MIYSIKSLPYPVVIILLLLSCVCCSRSPDQSWTIQSETLDGVQTVRIGGFNRNALPVPWQIDTLLTIGSATGEDAYLLNRPGWVVVDSAGCIYVGDWGNYRIQKYASDGNWLLSFSRQGSGPGEIRTEIVALGGLALWSNNRLAVTDQRQQRLHLFNADNGLFLKTFHLKNSNVVGPVFEFGPAKAVLKTEVFREASRIISVTQLDCSVIDTLVSAPLNPWQSLSSTSQFFSPYYPMLQWSFSRDGETLAGTGVPYQIDWYDTTGKNIRRLIVEWIGQKVTAADRELVRSYIRNSPYGDPAMNARNAKEVVFPEFKTAYSNLFIDDVGRIWVEHSPVPFDRAYRSKPYKYDLFSPDLEPLGLLSVPFRVEKATKDQIYGIGRGPEGEGIILVCSLTTPK